MPAPRKFLLASTTLPLQLDWGWNVSVYLAMLLGLLGLIMLLLWMLIKQLRHSVGKATLQLARSFRQLPANTSNAAAAAASAQELRHVL